MCNIFLSYSRKDYDIVRKIKQEIEQATKAKCWMDLEGISYESPDFTKIIAPAIEQASIFVFILTPNSQESRYARNELLLAKTRNKHIFFVEPRECKMTSEFILEYGHYNRNLYYVDYQKQKLYEEILELLTTVEDCYYPNKQESINEMVRIGHSFFYAEQYEAAVPYYMKAADLGNPSVQLNLGWMYDVGKGISKNYSEALKWYRMSAEQGNAIAQCNLGYMYKEGKGVARNDAAAVRWFRMSANQGNSDAQTNLGWYYEFGRGVKVLVDKNKAIEWYKKAAEQGNDFAKKRLKELIG